MADPKTFTLIGEFKDGITPELTKINKQLANFNKTLGALGGKGSRRTARDMGKFVSALNGVNSSLQVQTKVLKGTIAPMRQYRREVGKTIGALKKLDQLGGGSIAIERTNKALKEQIRLMDQLNSRRGRPRMAPPGGGGMRPGRARAGGGGRGPRGGGGGGYDFNMGGFAFGYQIGQGLAGPLTNVLMSGFTAGAALIQKTFTYFAGSVGERVKDEMEDISAAGGYFSIARRQGDKSFLGKDPSLDRALEFTENTNRILGNLARDLPGATRDYVMVSKRIGDSVARVVASNEEGATALAAKLRVGNEAYYKDIEAGAAGTLQVLLGELTKKSVMAGLGGTTGRGGPAGPYGLPGLTERLLTDQDISQAQLGRYASVYGDPKVSAAIGRLMPKLKEAGGDMVKRFELINSFYDEIVPEAMVQKMRRSTSGLMEALNSAIFDPEIGFLGLGRKLEGFGYKMNDFGEYLNEAGEVVGTAAEAARMDIDIFKMFRDVLANVFMVLQPIVDNLSMIWDPLAAIGESLTNARHYTAEFYKSFQRYEKGLMELQGGMSGADALKFGKTRKLRASLMAVSNLFAELGVFSDADFSKFAKKIQDPDANLGSILSGFVQTFFSSKAAAEVGKFFGELLGTVLTQLSNVTGFLSKRLGAGQLAGGFFAAFEKAGGSDALTNIFSDLNALIMNALRSILPRIPLKVYLMGLLTVLIPAIINALTFGLGQAASELGRKGLGKLGGLVRGRTGASAAQAVRGGGAGMNAAYLSGRPAAAAGAKGAGGALQGLKGLKNLKFLKNMGAIGKVGGIATIGLGIVDAISALLSGESLGKALGAGAGPVVGAFIGAALTPFFPPLGAAIGGLIGAMKPVTDFFGEIFMSLGGTFGGLIDVVGQLLGIILDGLGGLGRLFNAITGLGDGFDILKVILAPLTLAFQLIEMGVKGLALALARFRKWMADWMGTEEEKQARAADVAQMERNLGESRGRINAYNASMLSNEQLKAQLNDAIYEFNNSKQYGVEKGAELKSFIENAKLELARREGTTGAAATSPEAQQTATATQATATNSVQIVTQTTQTAAETAKIVTNTAQANTTLATVATNTGSLQGGINSISATASMILTTLMSGVRVTGNVTASLGLTPDGTKPSYRGSLGDAISSEMRNKPRGSSLVIANSSETVIPAAGGYGMKEFLSQISTGMVRMGGMSAGMYGGGGGRVSVNAPITINQQAGQDAEELASIVAMKIGEAVAEAQQSSMYV